MPVTLEIIEHGIALLQVDRPEVRNALNWEDMQAFAAHIEEVHAMPDLRVLIVSGAGKAFISGGDLRVLRAFPAQADGLRLSRAMTAPLNRLEAVPCPVIAALNGPARGGGAEIALACDIRILSADADIGFVQVNLGLTPGWGAGQRLLRLVGYSLALQILAGGKILSASEALEIGLANQIAAPGEAFADALVLARLFAEKPPEAVKAVKRVLRGGLTFPPATAAAAEQAEFPPLWAAEAHLQAVEDFLNSKGKSS